MDCHVHTLAEVSSVQRAFSSFFLLNRVCVVLFRFGLFIFCLHLAIFCLQPRCDILVCHINLPCNGPSISVFLLTTVFRLLFRQKHVTHILIWPLTKVPCTLPSLQTWKFLCNERILSFTSSIYCASVCFARADIRPSILYSFKLFSITSLLSKGMWRRAKSPGRRRR